MRNIEDGTKADIPRWAIYGSFVLSVIGLAALAAIETSKVKYSGWISFVLVALLYILVQIVTEGILSIYLESKRWLVKIIPVLLIMSFYGIIFIIK